jgi:hypothetical protein
VENGVSPFDRCDPPAWRSFVGSAPDGSYRLTNLCLTLPWIAPTVHETRDTRTEIQGVIIMTRILGLALMAVACLGAAACSGDVTTPSTGSVDGTAVTQPQAPVQQQLGNPDTLRPGRPS